MRPEAETTIPITLQIMKRDADEIEQDEPDELCPHAMLRHNPSKTSAIVPCSLCAVIGFAGVSDRRVFQKTPTYTSVHERENEFGIFAGTVDGCRTRANLRIEEQFPRCTPAV